MLLTYSGNVLRTGFIKDLSVYLPVCLSIHLPLDIFKEERIKCGANYFMFLLPHFFTQVL